MKNKKSRAGFWWCFDRVFGDNRKVGWQIVYILGLVALLVLVVAGVGCLLPWNDRTDGDSALMQSISLSFGASGLPSEGSHAFPVWWQVVATLLGAVVFSGVTITFVGNMLGNRQKAYRLGTVRYRFENHVLVLGGDELALTIVKEAIAEDRHRHVVVLTSADVQGVRLMLDGHLGDMARRGKVTVLNGRHDDRATLQSLHIDKASQIFIVGEDARDEGYDARNIACWNAARELCAECVDKPCWLFLEQALSSRLFYLTDMTYQRCFNTNVVLRPEAEAQRILVHNSSEDEVAGCPPLDRDGIGPDSGRRVHLVLYGMTPFACSMAVTAAHLCHFPNAVDPETYDVRRDRRTKITFIAPDMAKEMQRFKVQYRQLAALSTMSFDGSVTVPDEDFLDVEWEFVDGDIEDDKVRALMERYYADNAEGRTYLTVALCLGDTQGNIAAALQLPEVFHTIVEGGDHSVDYRQTIPLLVYQCENKELALLLQESVEMYRNIFPVGGFRDIDFQSMKRRLQEGKRLNYIYCRGSEYTAMTDSQAELERLWKKQEEAGKLSQLSNKYCANHIGVKMRSIAAGGGSEAMTDELAEVMAVVEHNRWNMEKLLLGYAPISKEQRETLKALDRAETARQRDAMKKELKQLRTTQYRHYCIAPYSQLLDGVRYYDRWIVDYIKDVVR